ncbi:hypothetical protein P8C59_006332 [Phyllachora maydis]|uniref:Arrestin C-terminal-like domain-containing protein n=1 Tax=Phyllachora maydis TaxID=1825666 RepID=A0AAD9I6J3_9PEZI|nr:hypothetical protein P8C59_006332 [Phyllachora maydis]
MNVPLAPSKLIQASVRVSGLPNSSFLVGYPGISATLPRIQGQVEIRPATGFSAPVHISLVRICLQRRETIHPAAENVAKRHLGTPRRETTELVGKELLLFRCQDGKDSEAVIAMDLPFVLFIPFGRGGQETNRRIPPASLQLASRTAETYYELVVTVQQGPSLQTKKTLPIPLQRYDTLSTFGMYNRVENKVVTSDNIVTLGISLPKWSYGPLDPITVYIKVAPNPDWLNKAKKVTIQKITLAIEEEITFNPEGDEPTKKINKIAKHVQTVARDLRDADGIVKRGKPEFPQYEVTSFTTTSTLYKIDFFLVIKANLTAARDITLRQPIVICPMDSQACKDEMAAIEQAAMDAAHVDPQSHVLAHQTVIRAGSAGAIRHLGLCERWFESREKESDRDSMVLSRRDYSQPVCSETCHPSAKLTFLCYVTISAMDDLDDPSTTPCALEGDETDRNAADEALEDEAQDFRLFESMFRKRGGLSAQTIRKGTKDFEAHGTRAQESSLNQSLQAMEEILSYTRVHTAKDWTRGWYFPDKWAECAGDDANEAWEFPQNEAAPVVSNGADGHAATAQKAGSKQPTAGRWPLEACHRVVVVERSGSTDRSVGRAIPNQAKDRPARSLDWLLPEEALYLVERGALDLWHPFQALEDTLPPKLEKETGIWERPQHGAQGDPDEFDLGVPLSLEAAYSLLIGEDGERGKVSLRYRRTADPSSAHPCGQLTRLQHQVYEYMAVVDAQETSTPTYQETMSLLDAIPETPPPAYLLGPDHGVINYMRFSDANFGAERLYEDFDRKTTTVGGPKTGDSSESPQIT